MRKIFLLVVCLVLGATRLSGDQDYPLEIGDLVFRKTGNKIYGLNTDLCWDAANHPGHVGVYVGSGKVVGAMGWDFNTDGFVVETPLAAAAGVMSFYEIPGEEDGDEDHEHLGAKTHRDLPSNADEATLRANIVFLAREQVGEGYDNGLGQQKGPGGDEWACSGLIEKVYESCAGQTLVYPQPYGSQTGYEGGMNITPDGFDRHLGNIVCYYQNQVEFSQIVAIGFGRQFPGGVQSFAFFPYTQYQQSTLIDSRAEPPRVIGRQHGTSRDTTVYITFSEDIDSATLTAANITVVGNTTGPHSCQQPFPFSHSTHVLTLNPLSNFAYGETVTVTIGSGVKDLAGHSLDGDGDGDEGPSYTFTFSISAQPLGPRTSINITSILLSPSTVDPYGTFDVTGSASYNNGEVVNDGTATIVIQDGTTYSAAVTGGTFSRSCQAPGNSGTTQISKTVTTTVRDGIVTQDAESRTLYIRGENSTSYDLETYIVHDYDGDDQSVDYSWKDAFRTTDPAVDLLAIFDNMTGSGGLDLKWRCYRPDGTQYGSDLDWNDAVDLSWGWGWAAWGWNISGAGMASNPGKYSIKFYVNGSRKVTKKFVVGWDFTRHFMCRDRDDDWNPIGETGVFSTSDTKAMALHHFEYQAQPIPVRTAFYRPDGGLEQTSDWTIDADTLGSHEWYETRRHQVSLGISGTPRAFMCGDWTVKFYVKNPVSGYWQQKYTDYFRIEEGTSPSTFVSASPTQPIESQVVRLSLNATDNNHLTRVSVYWNDGVWHTNTWQSINSSSWSGSQVIGSSVPAGQVVEYWCEAWDESGNRAESSHQTVAVQPELVTIPDLPIGPVRGGTNQVLQYTTAGCDTTLGGLVDYQFSWGDGTQSSWGGGSRSRSWSASGSYLIQARGRSRANSSRVSDWSNGLLLVINPPPPMLVSTPNSNRSAFSLTWTGTFNLQFTTNLTSSNWVNLGVSNPPFATPATENAGFYRLQGF